MRGDLHEPVRRVSPYCHDPRIIVDVIRIFIHLSLPADGVQDPPVNEYHVVVESVERC